MHKAGISSYHPTRKTKQLSLLLTRVPDTSAEAEMMVPRERFTVRRRMAWPVLHGRAEQVPACLHRAWYQRCRDGRQLNSENEKIGRQRPRSRLRLGLFEAPQIETTPNQCPRGYRESRGSRYFWLPSDPNYEVGSSDSRWTIRAATACLS